MHAENLIKMANQIGAFFEAIPDHDQAVADALQHFKNTWEPRMRKALLEYIERQGDAELKPIVREAMARLRASL
jgi:formate dehydrogenase subunit delta